ncbi:MAG: VanZ family protein [Candidatus Marinimicrobia bacterium]|nr:VanZ family protein [Candidatus Neomarinimicrobiota bacterium]
MNVKLFKVATGFYLVLILSLSSIPGHSFPESKLFSHDKVIHLIEYAILGGLIISVTPKTKTMLISAIAFCVLFGAMDEMWQIMIPGRFSSGFDWIADSVGGAIGIFAVKFFRRKK